MNNLIKKSNSYLKEANVKNAELIAHLIPEPKENKSVMERLAEMSISNPELYSSTIDKLVKEKGDSWVRGLKYNWSVNARPKQCMPEGTWSTWVTLAGRAYGKMLSLSEYLATPYGYVQLKDLKEGDELFNEQGNICKVLKLHPIQIPEKSYRLTFDDGTYIDSCSEHYWQTIDEKSYRSYKYKTDNKPLPKNWINFELPINKKLVLDKSQVEKIKVLSANAGHTNGQLQKEFNVGEAAVRKAIKEQYSISVNSLTRKLTTQEIVDSLISTRGNPNHLIKNTLPLKYKTYKNLLIDPWVFGYLLGDGDTSPTGRVSSDTRDIIEIKEKFNLLGYTPSKTSLDKVHFHLTEIIPAWKELGMPNGKFIPDSYLYSNIQSRWDLLSGLISSDGTVTKKGVIVFYNTNKKLIDGFIQIAHSLGLKTKLSEIKGRLRKGRVGKVSWSVHLIAYNGENLTLISRKEKRLRIGISSDRAFSRYIVKAEEIKSEPMRCITVDSLNSTYLVGKQMVCTSNTKLGAEAVKYVIENGLAKRIALVGPTISDTNGVMISGESGIMNCYPAGEQPEWNKSARTLTWFNDDGSIKATAHTYSGDAPERLRGPQHDFGWVDELCSWRYQYAWDMYEMGLRLGEHPRTIVTTTPKPIPILLDLLKLPTTYTTTGTTFENKANLPKLYFDSTVAKYIGSPIGKQELLAHIMTKIDDAMWEQEEIDAHRLDMDSEGAFRNLDGQTIVLPQFLQIIIAIDPATTTNNNSAETAMCVAAYGEDGRYYVLYLNGAKESPDSWGRRAVQLFNDYGCDKMVAEVNNGGDLVEHNIKVIDSSQRVEKVHASRSKTVRADPIATLYAQGKVSHVGRFARGETQMCTFNPQANPKGLKDMVDALVWAMTFLKEFADGNKSSIPLVGGRRTGFSKYQSFMNSFKY